jgi:hypothetical protein
MANNAEDPTMSGFMQEAEPPLLAEDATNLTLHSHAQFAWLRRRFMQTIHTHDEGPN